MELLEIEKELAGADGEAAMRRYDEVLLALSIRAGESVRCGLPPEEFAKCTQLIEAVTVARKLLRLQLKKDDLRSTPTPKTYT